MSHLTDETLVELHYGDAEAETATRGQEHLDECGECRVRRDALSEVLALADTAEVPERSESYGGLVWERMQRELLPARFSAGDARTGVGNVRTWRRWPVYAGLAAALVLAFSLGRHTQAPAPVPSPVAEPGAGAVRERILLVAVGDHLDRSQMVLVELTNATAGKDGLDVAATVRTAGDLVGEGRLFRAAAARDGEPGVLEVLDDLERVLVEVARGPERLDEGELVRLQKRIEAQGLLFKLRVVGAKVREREQDAVRAQLDIRS